MARVLIAGCGYVGLRLGLDLLDLGHSVLAVRRKVGTLRGSLDATATDLTDPEAVARLPFPFDTVIYTAAAGTSTPEAYEKAYVHGPRVMLEHLDTLPAPRARFLFCSSTSVYGESSGEWVDESTPPRPTGFRGEIVLRGEGLVRASGLVTACLRLGGIYGPGRTRLVDSVREGRVRDTRDADVYTNRIHRDDAAAALAHLMAVAEPQELYVGVDQEPALRSTVVRWLAHELGVDPERDSGPRSDPRGKRCCNQRLLDSGFRLRYPTFREGYRALLAHG